MKLNTHQEDILRAIDSAADTIINVSHQIHSHPEIGYEEVFASGLLVQVLETNGFEVEREYAGIPTAFCARKGKRTGPRIAFLAEYDALPGIGHACGHNMIASAALGAGIGLGKVIEQTSGEVLVIGTPAEETDGAKVVMVERGAFQQVDAALMIHAHEKNYYLTENLAMDALEVHFFGKAAHAAAAPWDGINALDALILTFTSINALRQQVHPDARIHGVITQGGEAPNIIPEHTVGRFYIRAKTRSYLNELRTKIKACIQSAALATGTRYEINHYENSFDDMVNNRVIAERMRDYMTEVLGSEPFLAAPESFGSADMGNVSHVVPAVHILIDIADGKQLSPHTHDFQQAVITPYADGALVKASKAMALTGYDLLTDSGLLDAAHNEFSTTLGYLPAKSRTSP